MPIFFEDGRKDALFLPPRGPPQPPPPRQRPRPLKPTTYRAPVPKKIKVQEAEIAKINSQIKETNKEISELFKKVASVADDKEAQASQRKFEIMRMRAQEAGESLRACSKSSKGWPRWTMTSRRHSKGSRPPLSFQGA